MKQIIYTDLDGTLLDFTDYSYRVIEESIACLKSLDIPVIFCSSKTRAEQAYYLQALDLHSPFIVENGSAIFIPAGFFDFELSTVSFLKHVSSGKSDGHDVLVLGTGYHQIRQVLERARKDTGLKAKGYADLSVLRIMALTGLDQKAAERAAQREFSETLLEGVSESEAWDSFLNILNGEKLQCVSGGKFHTIMGVNSDKGKAVALLNELMRLKYGEIHTIGLGDSANDLPLLHAVDQPFLVRRRDGSWLENAPSRVEKVSGIGPAGWKMAISQLFNL
ncbi:MAG: HAD-IIB family hydrolase [Cyclobacteriaceae bacterium]